MPRPVVGVGEWRSLMKLPQGVKHRDAEVVTAREAGVDVLHEAGAGFRIQIPGCAQNFRRAAQNERVGEGARA